MMEKNSMLLNIDTIETFFQVLYIFNTFIKEFPKDEASKPEILDIRKC